MFKDRYNPLALMIVHAAQEEDVRRKQRSLRRNPNLGPVVPDYGQNDQPVMEFGNLRSSRGQSRIIIADFTHPFSGADEFSEQSETEDISFPKWMSKRALAVWPGTKSETVTGNGIYRVHKWNVDQLKVGNWDEKEAARVRVTLEVEMPAEGDIVLLTYQGEPRRKLLGRNHNSDFGRIPKRTLIFKA
jgi:hypothetical protein